jgi:hypothetical protein
MQRLKSDDFNERRNAAAEAKAAMLARFRARPGPDDPAVLERQAELAAIAKAREERAAERRLAREAEQARIAAEKLAAAAALKAQEAEKALRDQEARKRAALLAAEQKKARDERYAARKARRR